MCTKTGIDMLQFHSSIRKYEFYRHTIFFVFHIFAAICLTMCPQVLRCYETLYTFCSDQSTRGMSSYTKNLEYHSLKFYISQPNISHLLVIFVFPLCITIIHEGHSSCKWIFYMFSSFTIYWWNNSILIQLSRFPLRTEFPWSINKSQHGGREF